MEIQKKVWILWERIERMNLLKKRTKLQLCLRYILAIKGWNRWTMEIYQVSMQHVLRSHSSLHTKLMLHSAASSPNSQHNQLIKAIIWLPPLYGDIYASCWVAAMIRLTWSWSGWSLVHKFCALGHCVLILENTRSHTPRLSVTKINHIHVPPLFEICASII